MTRPTGVAQKHECWLFLLSVICPRVIGPSQQLQLRRAALSVSRSPSVSHHPLSSCCFLAQQAKPDDSATEKNVAEPPPESLPRCNTERQTMLHWKPPRRFGKASTSQVEFASGWRCWWTYRPPHNGVGLRLLLRRSTRCMMTDSHQTQSRTVLHLEHHTDLIRVPTAAQTEAFARPEYRRDIL